MEFLFVGCSITWGDELKDRFSTRYSKLICKALGATENNTAECGRSNDWIARRTVEETRKKKYDRVYVQLTVPSRIEYFTEDAYSGLRFKLKMKGVEQVAAKMYYSNFYNARLGIENLYKNKFIIESAVTDTELIFISFDSSHEENEKQYRHIHDNAHWNSFCKIESIQIFEDILEGYKVVKNRLGPRGHPLESEHQKIADYLLSI